MFDLSQTFYARNREPLQELYRRLSVFWSGDLRCDASAAQRMWLGDEHGQLAAPCDARVLETCVPLFRQMGLIDELHPAPETVFDQADLLGVTFEGNIARFKLLRHIESSLGCALGEVVCWFGQRLRDARDGTIDRILVRLEAMDTSLLDHPWIAAQRALDRKDPNPWRRPFATEYELGLAAAFCVFGSKLELVDTARCTESSRISGVPGRTITHQRFRCTSRRGDFVMLNARAEQRVLDGRTVEPRHTTLSSLRERLQTVPMPMGARIAFITGNPHAERTYVEAWREITAAGRDDVSLIPIATQAARSPDLSTSCLGEIARILHNESLRVA